MAVIKHISVKGSNGGDALNYVLYKHNEKTGELIVDGRGNPVMRAEYYLDGINCEPYSFAAECKEVNDLYGKNQLPGDIKAHHFIISYDPKDGVENGLTGPKAQQLSMEWAKRCLPGFQILVCTHMDGSNESGNIHTHIMMNSVRKYDTQLDDYGERSIDHLAGYKLNLTKNHLQFMKQELMNICNREGLNQIDLISPAKNRITDKEYRVQLNGQDHPEDKGKIEGNESERTTFQTQKQYLRDAVMSVATRATSFDEFRSIMKENYDITVKVSRGRISYLHPDREKCITGRALGTLYEKESVIQIIYSAIEDKVSDRNEVGNDFSLSTKTMKDCKKVFEMSTDSRLVARLQKCVKGQISVAYTQGNTLSRVRVMADTIIFVQRNGFKTVEEIDKEIRKAKKDYSEISRRLAETKDHLKDINETIHYLGQYLVNKNAHYSWNNEKKGEFKASRKDGQDNYNEAIRYLRTKYGKRQFPQLNELKKERDSVSKEINEYQRQQNTIKDKKMRLETALNNIKMIVGGENKSFQAEHQEQLQEGTIKRKSITSR